MPDELTNDGQILRVNVNGRMIPAKIMRWNKLQAAYEETDFDSMREEVSRSYVDPTAMISLLMDGGNVQTPYSTFKLEAA